MSGVDPDRRRPFRVEGVIVPHRQRTSLEHHSLGRWRALAENFRDQVRIRWTFAAPDPLAVTPHRNRRLLQRHVKTDIVTHGCSPFDAWARRPVVSPSLHPIGEQPPDAGSSRPLTSLEDDDAWSPVRLRRRAGRVAYGAPACSGLRADPTPIRGDERARCLDYSDPRGPRPGPAVAARTRNQGNGLIDGYEGDKVLAKGGGVRDTGDRVNPAPGQTILSARITGRLNVSRVVSEVGSRQ